MQVSVEGVGDAKKSVDPRRPPAALEASDRRLGGSHELGEIGLGEAALLPSIRDLPGDLREQPALLGAGEPCTNSLHGLTHISIMLYIAVVRYWDSIAVYLMGVAAFMVYLAFAPSHGSFLIALGVLAVLHFVVGFAAGDMKILGLVVFLPVFAGFVPIPDGTPGEPLPWFISALFLGVPCAVILMTLGVGSRTVVRWRQRGHR